MTGHISPDEFWLALERLKSGGWTDEEIFEQVRHVVIARCKRWLIEKGYIQEDDNPMTEYIHIHFTETMEDEAVAQSLRLLDHLTTKLYNNGNLFDVAVNTIRLVAAISFVGLSTEDLISREEAKQKVKTHLRRIAPETKVNQSLQDAVDKIVPYIKRDEGSCTLKRLTKFFEGNEWEQVSLIANIEILKLTDTERRTGNKNNEKDFKISRGGETWEYYKFSTLKRYYTRHQTKIKK